MVLSKLHSAVITTDPVANLYLAGIGRGGRLGLGDENTRFNYTPVQGGIANKHVVQVALGTNHSMAITDTGELWAWGSNSNSQLGYALPEPVNKGEEPFSATPRQVFGALKKEAVIGVAASAIHSVAHTGTSLYCWGKNVGQLALMDADSRSLEVQQVPRKVAASLFSSPIVMVSAIDKATTCLLANHTVCVFTSYGYNIVKFPFTETFSNYHLRQLSMSSRYDAERNQIKYIASGGETISAVTGRGDLFTMSLTQRSDEKSETSTTNPSKIKGAVTQPQCIWTAHKDGVRSVDVSEHGSVIISTQSGAVWRRVKRAKAKDSYVAGSTGAKRKDFKFQRVPSITNIVTVRSSVFGAFAAVRKDSEVVREQIHVDGQTIWDDVAPLNCLRGFKSSDPSTTHKERANFWKLDRTKEQLGSVAYEVLKSPDLEADFQTYLTTLRYQNTESDTVVCTSSSPDLTIPVHSWLLSARSPGLRRALAEFRRKDNYELTEYLTISKVDGKTTLMFTGLDLISVLNLVLYLYEDRVIPAWNFTRHDPSLAYRYRQIRAEVIRVAAKLEMITLEVAAQRQVDPKRSLDVDLDLAMKDRHFLHDGDALLELDGAEVPVHSALLCQRCPFFEGLFHGRSQGMWLASRREAQGAADRVRIDLKHVDPETFQYVLRHLYADTGRELFDTVVSDNLDDFSDLVLDVLAVANELMLDRLSQICQQVLGRFVNTRNVAHYLNAVGPFAVTDFKDAGLEYICLQLESMLENHLLDDLDEDLLLELDEVVRDNQLARCPFAKSGRAELLLHEKYPELAEDITEERQRRVREMAFRVSQRDEERKVSSSFKARFGSVDDLSTVSSIPDRTGRKSQTGHNEPFSPDLRPKASLADLMFDMDEDEVSISSPSIRPKKPVPLGRGELERMSPLAESWRDTKGNAIQRAEQSPMLTATATRASMATPMSPDLLASSPHLSDPKTGGNPWGSANLPTSKLDLREILTENYPNRSALSAGIAAQKAKEAAAKPQQIKMSQKERKKQQQQMQAAQCSQSALTPPVKAAWEKENRSGPWKTVEKSSTPLSLGSIPIAKPTPPQNKPLVAAESTAKSIPRRTQSPDTRFSGQSRQSSTPSAPSSMRPSPTPAASASKPLVPHSKSYIKPSSKSEPTLGLSMADIIGQQRREQEIVKEAVAKRSLQEIQEEQAFQEWWEEESKRAQEEEARRLAREKDREESKAGAGGSKARRGRSGKARGGQSSGGRGEGAAGATVSNAGAESQAQSKDRGQGRGRPRGRGRGGGAKT